MRSLVLIPWSDTVWSEAGRMASSTPLPLTGAGRAQASHWANALPGCGCELVVSSDEQTAKETARILAKRCGARHRIVPKLDEIDVGLWEGLTADELKRRHTKAYRRWCEDPSSVRPPEGEDLGIARSRVRAALERLLRKHTEKSVAVVLGPLAFAMICCVLEGLDLSELRTMLCGGPRRYDLDDETRELPTGVPGVPIDGPGDLARHGGDVPPGVAPARGAAPGS